MSRTKIGIGMKRHRIYGYSKIIKHPQGWEYRVAYLSPQKTLSYSKLLWARWSKKVKGEYKYIRWEN